MGLDLLLAGLAIRLHGHDADLRLQGQAKRCGVDPDTVPLPLLHRHPPEVDIARLFNDAVERGRQGGDAGFGGRRILEHVGKAARPQQERRRRITIIFERAGGLGHRDRLVDVAERIADQLHLQRLAGGPAGRIGGERTAEAADVHGIGRWPRPENRPADLDVGDRAVGSRRRIVGGQLQRHQRILRVQRVVVVDRQLAAVRIEHPHGQVGGVGLDAVCVRHVADPDRVDLDGEPAASGHRHAIEVYVTLRLFADRTADGDVRRHRHRRRERIVVGRLPFLVGLDLVDDGERTNVKGRGVRELGLRPDPEDVLARRTVRCDLERTLHRAVLELAVVGDVDHLDARPIKDELLRVGYVVARDRDRDSGAHLAAPRTHRVEVVPVGISRPDGHRNADDRGSDRHAGPRNPGPREQTLHQRAANRGSTFSDHGMFPDSKRWRTHRRLS